MSGRPHRVVAVLVAGMIVVSASGASSAPLAASGCGAYVPDAAARSELPENMIVRVMIAESGGDAHATSPKGAVGCMQIMPATWATLTARYTLGSDPYDPRANMIGGALYLAELVRRHGLPGAFAAYNAGEGRWLRYRAVGTPLPAETIAYMARLSGTGSITPTPVAQLRWQDAALFMARGGDHHESTARDASIGRSPAAPATPDIPPSGKSTLFPLNQSAPAERE